MNRSASMRMVLLAICSVFVNCVHVYAQDVSTRRAGNLIAAAVQFAVPDGSGYKAPTLALPSIGKEANELGLANSDSAALKQHVSSLVRMPLRTFEQALVCTAPGLRNCALAGTDLFVSTSVQLLSSSTARANVVIYRANSQGTQVYTERLVLVLEEHTRGWRVVKVEARTIS